MKQLEREQVVAEAAAMQFAESLSASVLPCIHKPNMVDGSIAGAELQAGLEGHLHYTSLLCHLSESSPRAAVDKKPSNLKQSLVGEIIWY